MKVTTDACLFGAWMADKFSQTSAGQENAAKIQNILEIGTGTGLLSLMMAQKTNALIDTIELDNAACLQAKENIEASDWKQRIRVLCGDAKLFKAEKTYDLIISNPPFFENQLRSENTKTNMARHDDALSLAELIQVVSRNLSSTGSFAVLLPYYRSDYFVSLSNAMTFHLFTRVDVKQSTNHNYFRSMLHFARRPIIKTETKELVIKDGNVYTKDFIALLKDYYLNF